MSSKKTTIYELNLPYFKKGDDLLHHLDATKGNIPEAFKQHAEALEYAASMCRRMASVAVEVPGIEVQADTHMITITGPTEQLEILTQGENSLLDKCPWYDDEDEDEDLDESESR